jgi:hypothetical protein
MLTYILSSYLSQTKVGTDIKGAYTNKNDTETKIKSEEIPVITASLLQGKDNIYHRSSGVTNWSETVGAEVKQNLQSDASRSHRNLSGIIYIILQP